MTLTADFTFLYSDTGQILNTDPVGNSPFVDITKVTGLDSTPLRITEHQREGMDGGFIDSQFEGMRLIVLDGFIYNATETFLDTLKANFAPSQIAKPFYFKAPVVGERIIYAKSYGINYPWDRSRGALGIVAFQIQLKCEDPSIYGPVNTGSTIIGGASTGVGWPIGFGLGFGGTTSTNGTVSVNNLGNKNADCTFTIYGPVTNPAISNDTLGTKITFNIVLASTDTLTVNLRNKTVILNSTANRRGTMLGTSKWFLLQPGVNSIRFLGTPGASAPSMTYNTRPAYR